MSGIKRISMILIILGLITGCGSKIPAATSDNGNGTQNTTPGASSSLNAQGTQQFSGTVYPGPIGSGNAGNNSTSGTLVIPTPSDGKGVVYGELKVNTETAGFYISNLFLSPVTSATEDLSSVTYSAGIDPVATHDSGTGQFVFTDVNPGQYALMIWTTNRAYPLADNLEKSIIVTVKPGDSQDLGIINLQ